MNKLIIAFMLGLLCNLAGADVIKFVTTGHELPSSVAANQTLNLTYEIKNLSTVTVPYKFVTTNPFPTNVTLDTTSSTCDLTQNPTTTPILAAGASCTIKMTFATGTTLGAYDKNIGTIESLNNLSLELKTKIVSAAHNLIIFGDSLSDIGNAGTFTNNDPTLGQQVWVKDVVADVALTDKTLVKGFALGNTDPNTVNVDFAIGGAQTVGIDSTASQLLLFIVSLAAYQEHVDPNTKILFWIGGNDLFANKDTQATVDNIKEQLDRLIADAGVQQDQIYIASLPLLGDVPSKVKTSEKAPLNTASETFNTQLHTMLATNLPSVHEIDIETIMKDILANPAQYGFDPSKIEDACGSGSAVNACTGYVFWDGIHPTVAAHKLIAEQFELVLN